MPRYIGSISKSLWWFATDFDLDLFLKFEVKLSHVAALKSLGLRDFIFKCIENGGTLLKWTHKYIYIFNFLTFEVLNLQTS